MIQGLACNLTILPKGRKGKKRKREKRKERERIKKKRIPSLRLVGLVSPTGTQNSRINYLVTLLVSNAIISIGKLPKCSKGITVSLEHPHSLF